MQIESKKDKSSQYTQIRQNLGYLWCHHKLSHVCACGVVKNIFTNHGMCKVLAKCYVGYDPTTWYRNLYDRNKKIQIWPNEIISASHSVSHEKLFRLRNQHIQNGQFWSFHILSNLNFSTKLLACKKHETYSTRHNQSRCSQPIFGSSKPTTCLLWLSVR